MSGKWRLSAAGKWLLTSDGKAKVCSCCGQCCDFYDFHFVYQGAESCCAWDATGRLDAAFTCEGDGSWNIIWDFDDTSILGILTRSGSTLTLYAEISTNCDGTIIYSYELPVDDCVGSCLPAGTYDLPFIGAFPSDTTCSSDLQVTITKQCCKCANKCWIFTIQAASPAPEEACTECAIWDYPVVYDPGFPLYTECLGPCDPADYGFPVAFCLVGGQVYLRASLELAPPAIDCDPFYLPYALATPVPLTADGCPQDGTYLLSYAGPTPDYPYDICDIPEINVTIEQVSCCTLNENPGTPNYYISFDYEYHSYYSIDGDAVDCDGNPNGVNLCNVVNSETDMLMVASGGSTLWLDNGAWSPTVDCGSYADVVSIDCIGGGEWELTFELIITASTIKVGGLTPIGTYPDIAICFNDGTNSHRLDVTNIVVTT